MSSFRKLITVARYANGHYVEGKWVEGRPVTIRTEMSVQPATSKETQALEQGRRDRESFIVFSSVELFPADVTTKRNCDRVLLFGNEFEVVTCGKFQSGIIDHYKSVVQKICIQPVQ